ncbi:MAG: DEAD/DEAH box helicase family protein [Gammaproteobacteria bacterium]|nr:DEAD/DEAH box helicase family protein [Gammaproteobacteria bacterium]
MNCPFCDPDEKRVFHEDPHMRCLWDGFPVSKGHALIVPRRHVANWFDASRSEQAALLDGIEVARSAIEARYAPAGYNIGVNIGEAAGQTVPHLHVHLIPRYSGDVADPRGGVRYVIPEKANYLKDIQEAAPAYTTVASILGNEANPLLPALLREMAQAIQLDLAVAFVTEAGLDKIERNLIDLVDPAGRNGRLRFLTGDYLGVTEPRALRRLLDLSEEYGERAAVRVFETDAQLGFHPKAYLVHRDVSAATAFIGSSNLTRHALERGLEWNQRIDGNLNVAPLRDVAGEFERLFRHPKTRFLTSDWIDRYAETRLVKHPDTSTGVDPEQEPAPEVPTPHGIQTDALAALKQTRLDGNRAGLVVMATGLGKTWLSAFDSESFKRVLFVAHREEILNQAMRTFRRIRPDTNFGLYGGGTYDRDSEVLFASVQTLSRATHLRQFEPDRFDYIVLDEFHHAAAATYRRLIDYFEPAFLLGLTATPERSDGGDLLALCGENLVYRCDLVDGIQRELLSPFRYYGVRDEVEFANIPWRNGRFDPALLEHAVATETRAANAYEQWTRRGQSRTLAFCVSMRHADFMEKFFRDRGVRAVAVHSGPRSAPRTQSLEQLESGELQIIFAVDMFNEGVDLPAIDTVLMLRPTESKILWLQQFGRGLRKADDKPHLSVIDYIGNHRTFLQVPMILLPGAGTRPGEVRMALRRLERGELELPPGCSVEYDLEALDILKQLAHPAAVADQVAVWYRSFRELHGRRPMASEAFHEGYDPRTVRTSYGSWLGFVQAEGDLDDAEANTFRENQQFFEAIEVTQMTRSYKMVTLQAMLAANQFPGKIGIDDLVGGVAKLASRSQLLAQDFGEALIDEEKLKKLLESNPIQAWREGRGTNNKAYFSYGDGEFATSNLDITHTEALQTLTREISDWRLAQYLERLHGEARYARQIVCKVIHSGGNPILMLPSRDQHPGIPSGWTPVNVGGDAYEANFVKIAVNVMRAADSEGNQLHQILRSFFGEVLACQVRINA